MITFPGLRRFVRLLKSKLFFAIAGCVSEGSTLAEAILMGTDAASGWVLDELEDGKPAPEASPLAFLRCFKIP